MKRFKLLYVAFAAAMFVFAAFGFAACAKDTDGMDGVGYIITFDANGGSAVTPVVTDAEGKLATIPTSTYAGHTLKGWFTAKTGGDQITTTYKFTADTTVYAQWNTGTAAPGEFTITFDANGGTLAGATSATTKNKKLEKLPDDPTPPEGNAFLGWYTAAVDGERVTTSTEFTENCNIYALYGEVQGDNYVNVGGEFKVNLTGGATSSDTLSANIYYSSTQSVQLSVGDEISIVLLGIEEVKLWGQNVGDPGVQGTGNGPYATMSVKADGNYNIEVRHYNNDAENIYILKLVPDAQAGAGGGVDEGGGAGGNKVPANEKGKAYLIFTDKKSFNTKECYVGTKNDAATGNGLLAEFIFEVQLVKGEIFRFIYIRLDSEKSNKSDDIYVGWLQNENDKQNGTGTYYSGTGSRLQRDNNHNITVLAAGTYKFYVSFYDNSGGSIWVDNFIAA